MSPELTDKLYDILNKIEVNKIGKNDYNRYASKEKLIPNLERIEKLSVSDYQIKVTKVL